MADINALEKKYTSPDIDIAETKDDERHDGNKYSLPYGLCKGAGINTEGMTPREAWEAYENKTGISKKEAEEKHFGEEYDSRPNIKNSSDKVGAQSSPLEFKTAKDGDDFFKKDSEKIQQLNKSTIEAIRGYTESRYEDINNYLRGKHVADFEKAEKDIAEIDNAIDKFELKDDIVVYRVQPINSNIKKGDEETWKAYTSTSIGKEPFDLDKLTPEDDIWNERVLFKITVPKGKRGMYINSVSAYKDAEYEYLLKRDTKAKVKDIKKEGKMTTIEWEVVD